MENTNVAVVKIDGDAERKKIVKKRAEEIAQKKERIKKIICRNKLSEKNLKFMIDLLVDNFSALPWDVDTSDGIFFGEKNRVSSLQYGVLDNYLGNEIVMPGLMLKNCYGTVNVSHDGIFSFSLFPAVGVRNAYEMLENTPRGQEVAWDFWQIPLLSIHDVEMNDLSITSLDGFRYTIYSFFFKIRVNKQIVGCEFKVKIRE